MAEDPHVMKPWERSEEPQPLPGNSHHFNIGHLNIRGAIKDKLSYLEHILVIGNYDIFGVTEIHLSETEETDIGITGYYVIAYPSSSGITDCRGIAIYIKDTLSVMKMNIAPQKQEDIEMVNITFNYSATKQLKIIFLYRPGVEENLARFKKILKESSKVRGVESIIMGDMNINWREESKQFHIHGVQQLVTEVTRPATKTGSASETETASGTGSTSETGTIIDHIWITKDIINLLNCEEENRNLLTQSQDIIDVLSYTHLYPCEELERLGQEKIDLELDMGRLQSLKLIEDKVLQNLVDLHGTQLENLEKRISCNSEILKSLNQMRDELKHQPNSPHGVDPHSNNITYKIKKEKMEKIGIVLSDHRIIRISLKRPAAEPKAGEPKADEPKADEPKADEAQAEREDDDSEGERPMQQSLKHGTLEDNWPFTKKSYYNWYLGKWVKRT